MNKERISLTLIFLISFIFLGLDILEDLSHGTSIDHILKEILIVLLGVVGVMIVWHKYFFFKARSQNLAFDLAVANENFKLFKEKSKILYEGLQQKIEEQFDLWQLTKAEKDIVYLLLKGMSNKDIAQARDSSEKTVTLQLNSVYKKTHLKSRSELSAFFLDDLFTREQ